MSLDIIKNNFNAYDKQFFTQKESGKINIDQDSIKNTDQAQYVIEKGNHILFKERVKSYAMITGAAVITVALVVATIAFHNLAYAGLYKYFTEYLNISIRETSCVGRDCINIAISKIDGAINFGLKGVFYPLAGFGIYKLVKSYLLPAVQKQLKHTNHLADQLNSLK